MKNALVGLFFGLLAVVQMTPIPMASVQLTQIGALVDYSAERAVTQIPTKAEDDVFREAVTDGFLVNHFFTTESPQTNATQLPSSDPKEAGTEEPSQEPSQGPSQEPSQEPSQGSTPSSLPNDTVPSTTTTPTSAAPPTGPAVSGFLSTLSSDSGSGDREESDQDATTSFNTTPVSSTDSVTAASTSTLASIRPRLFEDGEGSGSGSTAETSGAPSTSTTFLFPFETTQESKENSGSGSGSSGDSSTSSTPEVELIPEIILADRSDMNAAAAQPIVEPSNSPSPQPASGTPGWIIIVGFIVGVGILVGLCVAIATRDKWNGPRKVAQAEPKGDSSNQPNGQEMETFLSKEEPMQNGKSDYSVIPLEELPESYSSH